MQFSYCINRKVHSTQAAVCIINEQRPLTGLWLVACLNSSFVIKERTLQLLAFKPDYRCTP